MRVLPEDGRGERGEGDDEGDGPGDAGDVGERDGAEAEERDQDGDEEERREHRGLLDDREAGEVVVPRPGLAVGGGLVAGRQVAGRERGQLLVGVGADAVGDEQVAHAALVGCGLRHDATSAGRGLASSVNQLRPQASLLWTSRRPAATHPRTVEGSTPNRKATSAVLSRTGGGAGRSSASWSSSSPSWPSCSRRSAVQMTSGAAGATGTLGTAGASGASSASWCVPGGVAARCNRCPTTAGGTREVTATSHAWDAARWPVPMRWDTPCAAMARPSARQAPRIADQRPRSPLRRVEATAAAMPA